MREPEPLADFSSAFRALAARDRRAVRAALTPAERARLDALLACESERRDRTAPAEPHAGFTALVRARLRVASGEGAADAPWQMTAAGRQLLLKCAGESPGGGAAAVAAAPARGSLVDVVGRLLSLAGGAR